MKQTVERLILEEGATCFYVGNHGAFDRMVAGVLQEIEQVQPHIRWYVVLAYLPTSKNGKTYTNTLYPEGLETVPPRFAVCARNEWMIKQADTVVAYVAHKTGGAAQFAQKAKKMGRRVIELAPF